MKKVELMELYYWNRTEESALCINCRYFHRHYTEEGYPLDCGHCIEPRMKPRKAYDTCDKFDRKERTERA